MENPLSATEGEEILRYLSNRRLLIRLTDGRRISGYLYCTDNYPNILISHAVENWEGIEDTDRRIGLVMVKRDIIESIVVTKEDLYIEEYYEEEEDNNDDEKVIPLHLQKKIEKSYEEKEFIEKIKIDDLIQLLNNERALNIECINVIKDKNELKANEIAVICSPFNNKHAEALVNIVRSFVKDNYKFEDKQYPRLTRNNNGWFTYDMRKVILHVLTDKMRRKYDLESLYRNVKDEDEEVVDPFNDKPVISNDGNLN
uniref:Sm domain-containing protein n=1 Tax=Parastrongyloides trichosuri TaxID=131310 RepID=A0A0N4Z7K6_PARTI